MLLSKIKKIILLIVTIVCLGILPSVASAEEVQNSYTNEDTIPIMNINIDEDKGSISDMNSDENHNKKCYGNISFSIPQDYKSQYGSNGIENNEQIELDYIKGRGNSSWLYDKKPYKIKLKDKTDLFGMGQNKHWVLIANYFDKSLIRNKLMYDLVDKIGMKYTPKSVFVDVVINGEYRGNYLLCEQIRVGKNRVDIDDLEKDEVSKSATDKETISGGYLIELDRLAENEDINFKTTTKGKDYCIASPSFDGYSNEYQFNYIKDYVNDFEEAAYSDNFCNKKGQHYNEFIDVDSLVDYCLIQEITKNYDALSNSTYLYKVRNGKMYFGPMWDFDLSMGTMKSITGDITGLRLNELYIIENLIKDPSVAKKIVNRYREIRDEVVNLYESTEENQSVIDKYVEQLNVSQKNNFDKWGFEIGGAWERDIVNKGSYDEEIKYLKKWLKSRVAWLDKNIEIYEKNANKVSSDKVILNKEDKVEQAPTPTVTPTVTPKSTQTVEDSKVQNTGDIAVLLKTFGMIFFSALLLKKVKQK